MRRARRSYAKAQPASAPGAPIDILPPWRARSRAPHDILGDWWTLLIVRDALDGLRRFKEFQRVPRGTDGQVRKPDTDSTFVGAVTVPTVLAVSAFGPRKLKMPIHRRIMQAMRLVGVTSFRLSAVEHVGQIGAPARFHFASPDGILGHCIVRKPAYEEGQK